MGSRRIRSSRSLPFQIWKGGSGRRGSTKVEIHWWRTKANKKLSSLYHCDLLRSQIIESMIEYLPFTREIEDIFYICLERSPFLLVLCHLFLYVLIRFFSTHGSLIGEYIESIHTQEFIEIYRPVCHREISLVCILELCEGKKLFTQEIELVELIFEEIILPYCRL